MTEKTTYHGACHCRRVRSVPHVWTINVRCRDGVDLDASPVTHLFGSRLP
jgi:hypothetical protein